MLHRARRASCGYPGHKGIPGNELADSAAKAAALTTSDPPRPISYASARSLIHKTLIDPPPTNSRTAKVYGGFSWSKDCMATSNRANAVLLARLRAGHTPLLKAYANLLDPSTNPLCPLCKEEPQTIEHWLRRCPRLDATKQNIFGNPSPPLKVLTTDPERVLALARAPSGRPLALKPQQISETIASHYLKRYFLIIPINIRLNSPTLSFTQKKRFHETW